VDLHVKPPCSPTEIILRCPQLEVSNFRVHRAAKTAGLLIEGAPDDEDSPPEHPMGFDPHETFT
jgi:hypothetical protein